MTADEIEDAVLNGHITAYEGLAIEDPRYDEDVLIIDQFAIIPVAAVSSSLRQDVDVEVVDPAGNSLGTLCFTLPLGSVTRSDLTVWQFAAYLADCSKEEIHDSHYTFKSNYIIIESSRVHEYRTDYMNSSPIWGRFSHAPLPSVESLQSIDKITAIPGIAIVSNHFSEAFSRYIYANNPLERFLRLYQSIELLFDFILVKRIKKLDNNIMGFPQLLSTYGSKELDRLRAIISEFCSNPQGLVDTFYLSSNHVTEREDIFFKHGKKENPCGEVETWTKLVGIIDCGEFTEQKLKIEKLVNNNRPMDKLIFDICSYWIYRIRCSIAHNRVGEFVLEDKHFPFISEFAEPMMLEVVKQVYSCEEFKSLIA